MTLLWRHFRCAHYVGGLLEAERLETKWLLTSAKCTAV
jgi:hypothetical protein